MTSTRIFLRLTLQQVQMVEYLQGTVGKVVTVKTKFYQEQYSDLSN